MSSTPPPAPTSQWRTGPNYKLNPGEYGVNGVSQSVTGRGAQIDLT